MVLELEKDFFSMSFCGYIEEVQAKYLMTKEEVASNFMNCLFLFGIQFALIVLIGNKLI
jgi:hypothetical protein